MSAGTVAMLLRGAALSEAARVYAPASAAAAVAMRLWRLPFAPGYGIVLASLCW